MHILPDCFYSKTELLDKIVEERRLFFQPLDVIGRDVSIYQAESPILQNGWSIKDTIAHITEWELSMIRCLKTSLRGEVPNQIPYELPDDEVGQINAAYYRRNKRKPLGQVIDESQDSYLLILDTIQRVSEEDLFDPHRFGWLAGKPFWPIVATNTCWHYEQHRTIFENAL
jgi:hypothetical protein